MTVPGRSVQSGFSRVAEALSDPAREAMVSALANGQAMPAGELASLAGIVFDGIGVGRRTTSATRRPLSTHRGRLVPIALALRRSPPLTSLTGEGPAPLAKVSHRSSGHLDLFRLDRTERCEIAGGIRPNFHIDAREMAKLKLIHQRINPIHKVWIIFGGK